MTCLWTWCSRLWISHQYIFPTYVQHRSQLRFDFLLFLLVHVKTWCSEILLNTTMKHKHFHIVPHFMGCLKVKGRCTLPLNFCLRPKDLVMLFDWLTDHKSMSLNKQVHDKRLKVTKKQSKHTMRWEKYCFPYWFLHFGHTYMFH